MKKFHRIIFILLLFLLVTMSMGSCKKSSDVSMKINSSIENTESNNSENSNNAQKPHSLEDAYFIPLSLDELLYNYPYEFINKGETTPSLEYYEEEVGINPREELKKYLQRKRVYDKSDIFREVP